MPNTKSSQKRKKDTRHHAGDHGLSNCPLCRKYPRFNEETLAAMREADEIMANINAGKCKGLPVDHFLAEMAAV